MHSLTDKQSYEAYRRQWRRPVYGLINIRATGGRLVPTSSSRKLARGPLAIMSIVDEVASQVVSGKKRS
jgi:hypothetical protein